MKVIRVLNNNIVATITDDNKEAIAQGSGIGFKKKPGDEIDSSKIEKLFIFKDEEKTRFFRLIEDIPVIYFEIAQYIAYIAAKNLNIKISNKVIISLTDHICFAVERKKQGITLPNLMLDEIKVLYPNEYSIGKEALDIIERECAVRLDEDEVGYIAIHIVNAELNVGSENTCKIINVSKKIINIIEEVCEVDFKQDCLKCSRLLIHLKFLAKRIFSEQPQTLSGGEDMYDLLVMKDKKLKVCMDKIYDYLLSTYKYEFSKDEQVYLMVHLLKVL